MDNEKAKRALETAVGFGDGVRCLVQGMRFTWQHRASLRHLTLVPMLVYWVVIVAALIGITHIVPALVANFWSEPVADAWWGIKHFLWQWLELPVTMLFVLVAVVGIVVLAYLIFSLFTAAFCDALSEKVEVLRGTFESRPFSLAIFVRDILESVRLELAHIGLKLVFLLPLFIASLVVPVVGQLAYVVVGGYLMARRTGMDYLDWCQARRGWTYKKRIEFMRLHRPAVLGLGTAVLLTWTLPLAFSLLWPAAVAGGAILFERLHDGEE